MRTVSAILILMVCLAGCDSGSAVNPPFALVFVDIDGVEVARADLSFMPSVAAESVGGSYEILSGTLADLPNSGGLRVSGLRDVIIQFDSGVADGGAFLDGRIDGDAFAGTWSVGTIAGPRPAGTFAGARRDQ